MRTKAAALWGVGATLHRASSRVLVRNARAPVTATGILVVTAVLAAGFSLVHRGDSLPDNAAFSLGNNVVTTREISRRAEVLEAMYGLEPPTGTPMAQDRYRRDVARTMAITMLLEQKAREMGIQVQQHRVRQTTDGYITKHFGPGQDAYDNFVDALGNVGTTERAVLDEVERHLLTRQLYTEVTRMAQVNEQDLRRAYDHFGRSLGTPETRRLRNIVVRTHRQAVVVARQARSGESFSTLAQRFSIDGSTRGKGGRIGTVAAGQLQDEYAAEAFSTPPGDIFGPVRTTHGWNIGVVEHVVPRILPDYASAREELRPVVQLNQRERRWAIWLETAMKEADLVYSAAYRPAQSDTTPPITIGGTAPWG